MFISDFDLDSPSQCFDLNEGQVHIIEQIFRKKGHIAKNKQSSHFIDVYFFLLVEEGFLGRCQQYLQCPLGKVVSLPY